MQIWCPEMQPRKQTMHCDNLSFFFFAQFNSIDTLQQQLLLLHCGGKGGGETPRGGGSVCLPALVVTIKAIHLTDIAILKTKEAETKHSYLY